MFCWEEMLAFLMAHWETASLSQGNICSSLMREYVNLPSRDVSFPECCFHTVNCVTIACCFNLIIFIWRNKYSYCFKHCICVVTIWRACSDFCICSYIVYWVWIKEFSECCLPMETSITLIWQGCHLGLSCMETTEPPEGTYSERSFLCI